MRFPSIICQLYGSNGKNAVKCPINFSVSDTPKALLQRCWGSIQQTNSSANLRERGVSFPSVQAQKRCRDSRDAIFVTLWLLVPTKAFRMYPQPFPRTQLRDRKPFY